MSISGMLSSRLGRFRHRTLTAFILDFFLRHVHPDFWALVMAKNQCLRQFYFYHFMLSEFHTRCLHHYHPRRGEIWFSGLDIARAQITVKSPVPQAAFGLAIDIYILVLPIIAVNQLQLPNRRKLDVIGLYNWSTVSLYISTAIAVPLTSPRACLSSLLNIYYRNKLSHSIDEAWNLTAVTTVT